MLYPCLSMQRTFELEPFISRTQTPEGYNNMTVDRNQDTEYNVS